MHKFSDESIMFCVALHSHGIDRHGKNEEKPDWKFIWNGDGNGSNSKSILIVFGHALSMHVNAHYKMIMNKYMQRVSLRLSKYQH